MVYTQITVKTLDGVAHPLTVDSSNTVQDVKIMVQQLNGVAPQQQTLLVNNKAVADAVTVEALGLNAELFLVANIEGGAKKRKKVYSSPKRVPHKNKKIKMRILQLYKVEGDVVQRLRKECPKCGSAYFMANHSDRYYCGHCHHTIKRTE